MIRSAGSRLSRMLYYGQIIYGRYVSERPHWYQCQLQTSSLGWYLQWQPAPPLKSEVLHLFRWYTHTHTLGATQETKDGRTLGCTEVHTSDAQISLHNTASTIYIGLEDSAGFFHRFPLASFQSQVRHNTFSRAHCLIQMQAERHKISCADVLLRKNRPSQTPSVNQHATA